MKTKTLYWIFTVLFALLMIFSGVQNAMLTPESIAMMHDQLGYPNYFTQFIGVAKVLGGIAILIPGYPKIKEWAYAGLLFDLAGAFYSAIAVEGFKPQVLIMLIFVALGVASYYFHHKLLKGNS